MILSAHDQKRIDQLKAQADLLDRGPVIHRWNRVDGLHAITANGKEYGPSKDLSDLLTRAAWDVLTKDAP